MIPEHAITDGWRARVRLEAARSRSTHAPAPLALALVGIAYFGVAKLGLSFSQGHAIVSAVWPPSGLALAAAFVFGWRVAPAIFLGALVADATSGSGLGTSAGIATGNALAAVTGGALLARASLEPALRRVRDVVALAILGAALSTAINATIGTSTLIVAGVDHLSGVWGVWRVWWLGDLTGVLLVAPPLLLLAAGGPWHGPDRHRTRIAEASLLAAALAGVMLLVLHEGVTLAFPIFPLIVLAAMRFRQAGAVTAALVVSSIAVVYTANGKGPFTGGATDTDLLSAQVFVALAALTGLLVAAMRTEWERAEDALERLAESEHALAEAQRLARIGSWEWDVTEDRLTWSDELFRIYGIAPDAFDARYESYVAHIHPDDRELVRHEIDRAMREPGPFRFEHRVVRPDGELRTVDGRGRVVVGADGRVERMVGTTQDVTEQRAAERLLAHQALHDPLTDLPNRALFLDRLQHALTRSRRSGSSVAVCFCDVDDFKDVNDSLGHECGDELLVALPPRLREALRAGDTVARFGGDEFVVLCEDLASEGEAIRIAERITEAVRLPFEHRRPPAPPQRRASGSCSRPAGRRARPRLLRDADAAMYRAKAGGKGRFEVFDAQHARAGSWRASRRRRDLRRALDEGELRLHYQPIAVAARRRVRRGSKRSCAGSIPSAGCSHRPSSSRSRRTAA